MKRTSYFALLALCLALATASAGFISPAALASAESGSHTRAGAAAMPSGSAQDALLAEVQAAFLELSGAESRGANVTSAALDLNRALALASSGDELSLSEAAAIVQGVRSSVPSLLAEGEAARYWGTVGLAAWLAALAAAGVLAYLYTPRLVWRAWMRSKRRWRVSAQ